MHQIEIEFPHCDVKDKVCTEAAVYVLDFLKSHKTITADDLAGFDTEQRSRNCIGGVFNGLLKAGHIKVTGRVASRVKANHHRYVNQYALAGGGL